MNAKKEPPKIRIPRKGKLVTKEQFIQVMRQLEPHLGIDIDIEGVQRAQSAPGGQFRFSQLPGSAAAGEPTDVFAVRSDYSIVPGLVGGKMPRIGTTAINASTPPTLTVSGSGTEYLYFRLNFTITLTNGYLSAYTLDTVDIIVQTTAPADDNDTKHLLFNTLTDGVPTTSYFDTSIPITLWDNGYDSTLLRYGNL